MNNLSENKVILTDEQYKSVQSDLVMWHIDLVLKLTFVALVIFLLTYAKLFFSVGGGLWRSERGRLVGAIPLRYKSYNFDP